MRWKIGYSRSWAATSRNVPVCSGVHTATGGRLPVICAHTPRESIPEHVVRRLFPHLDPSMVRAVMGRSTYTAPEEREAEHLASLIVERTGGTFARRGRDAEEPAGETSGADHTPLSRLALVFGSSASDA